MTVEIFKNSKYIFSNLTESGKILPNCMHAWTCRKNIPKQIKKMQFIPGVECILFSVILHAIFSLEEKLHPFEEWRSHRWRGFAQKYFHRVLQVHTHNAVATRGVGATLAVATVSQTICNAEWESSEIRLHSPTTS